MLLRMSDVTYRYPGGGRPALDGINLQVNAGDVLALHGQPGAGSSTLLLVAGGYAPRLVGGELRGERTIVAVRPAIVFATPWTQLTGLCQTVFSEVAFGPASFGWEPGRITDASNAALEKVGIAHLGPRDPAKLSGGELQRVIIASALAMEPDLLLLDDPAAELDPRAALSLYQLLPVLAASGAAIIVATPDLERARLAATQAIRLEAGRIAQQGDPAEVLA
jgi:energy-coupling factor transporter ATP-binding protein EcfA2